MKTAGKKRCQEPIPSSFTYIVRPVPHHEDPLTPAQDAMIDLDDRQKSPKKRHLPLSMKNPPPLVAKNLAPKVDCTSFDESGEKSLSDLSAGSPEEQSSSSLKTYAY